MRQLPLSATSNIDLSVTQASQTYWEAWTVSPGSLGKVDPSDNGVNDVFSRPPMPETSGQWIKRGKVYWVSQLDSNAGFAKGAVKNAGNLLSTSLQPSNLGSALTRRNYAGEWDSSGKKKTHTAK